MNLMPSIKNKFRTEFEFEKCTLKPKTVLEILALLLDLLTSRAFERVPRLWARSAIVRAQSASEQAWSASEWKRTRPEIQANNFEKVYSLAWKDQTKRLFNFRYIHKKLSS